jgi:hypothetical protein
MNLLTNGFVNNCGRLFEPPEQVKLASALRSHAMAARIQQAQLPSKDFFMLVNKLTTTDRQPRW